MLFYRAIGQKSLAWFRATSYGFQDYPKTSNRAQPSDAIARILEARHHNPFEVLGKHLEGDRCVVRALLPRAQVVRIPEAAVELTRISGTDLFVWQGNAGAVPERYCLSWEDRAGNRHSRYDPYCFPPQLADSDLRLSSAGRHWRAYRFLGAPAPGA